MLATSLGSKMPQYCFRRDQKCRSSPYPQAPASILGRWALLLLGKPACTWQGPGPGKGSARQAFAPHEVCRHPTAPWAWGDKPGRCWTNSLLGERRRNREESDFCPRPAPPWCHLAHVTSCSQGPQPQRDPAVRQFSTGSKEGIPEASLHPPGNTPGIPLPLPCHPALGTPPALTARPSVLQGHSTRTKTTRPCKPFPPGRDRVRQSPGAPCPRLCRCHRWPAGVRAREGTGRDGLGAGTDGQGLGRHRKVGEEAGTNGWGTGGQGSSGQGIAMDGQGRSNYEEETGRDEQK